MCMYIYFASVLPSFTASLFRRLFTPTPAGGQAELKELYVSVYFPKPLYN